MLRRTLSSEDGVGLVSAMLALSLLSLFAMVAAQLSVNETRASFNNVLRLRAFTAADSGGESAVGWLTMQRGPSAITDWASLKVKAAPTTNLNGTHQKFDYDIAFVQTRPRPGYDLSHMDFVYAVDAHGESGTNGNANVEMRVHKLNRSGH